MMQTIEKMRQFDPVANSILRCGTDAYERFMDIALHGDPTVKPSMIEIIRTKLEANNWSDATMTMPNGDTITIAPVGYFTPTCEQNTKYYRVYGGSNPNLGGDTLQKIAQQLENYESGLKD